MIHAYQAMPWSSALLLLFSFLGLISIVGVWIAEKRK